MEGFYRFTFSLLLLVWISQQVTCFHLHFKVGEVRLVSSTSRKMFWNSEKIKSNELVEMAKIAQQERIQMTEIAQQERILHLTFAQQDKIEMAKIAQQERMTTFLSEKVDNLIDSRVYVEKGKGVYDLFKTFLIAFVIYTFGINLRDGLSLRISASVVGRAVNSVSEAWAFSVKHKMDILVIAVITFLLKIRNRIISVMTFLVEKVMSMRQ